ncbi:MAG: efflux RND transporter periplasmic adaptor subunit [Polyangiales bacterium]
MGWVRRIVTGVSVAAALAAGAAAMRPKPTEVDAEPARAQRLVSTLDEEGRTRVRDRYVISATVTGNLRRSELHAGDEVAAGAVVARIVPVDPTPLDARSRAEAVGRVRLAEAALRQAQSGVERARGAADFARNDLERLRRLGAAGAVAANDVTVAEFADRSRRDELASSQFAARAAEYELANARAVLARATQAAPSGDEIDVRTPVRGRVLRVLQASGGVVTAGTPLVEVGDTTALEIVVDLLTADAAQVLPNAAVRVEGWGGDALNGHVRMVEPSAFTRVSALGVEEQRVNAIVDLYEPPERWRALGDGWRVEARITVWEAERVTAVPLGALFRRAGDWCVFVIENGRARRRPVAVGHRGGDRVEVTRGVRDGERVIVHPPDRLEDGEAVVAR